MIKLNITLKRVREFQDILISDLNHSLTLPASFLAIMTIKAVQQLLGGSLTDDNFKFVLIDPIITKIIV